MAHGSIQQIQLILQTQLLKVCSGSGVHPGALPAVFHIDGIHILHQLYSPPLSDIFMKGSPEIIGDIILSIRERSRSPETTHDGTGFTANAAFDPVPIDGTATLLQSMPRFKHSDLQLQCLPGQFIGRKNPSGTCSHYNNIILHGNSSLSFTNVYPEYLISYIGIP